MILTFSVFGDFNHVHYFHRSVIVTGPGLDGIRTPSARVPSILDGTGTGGARVPS